MALRSSHLDDEAFADVWSGRVTSGRAESDGAAETHLRACDDCRERYAAFSGWLETLRADATAEGDEIFSAERLGLQQAQIARRLEALEQPARVIAFPSFAQPISVQPSDGRRWIAAAAAAGLIVGLGLGQMLEFGGSPGWRTPFTTAPTQIVRGPSPGGDVLPALQPITAQQSDETFLYDVELVPSQARVPESLQYLNAITPSARDVDAR